MNRPWSTAGHALLRYVRQAPRLFKLPLLNCHRHVEFHSGSRCDAEVVPLRKQLKDANRTSRFSATPAHSPTSITDDVLSRWELTVGIEIHAQLNTARKLFSRSSSEQPEFPNHKISSFDIALPGSQPLFQRESLIPALRAALALECKIQNVSRFDRKHYFYHDQPAGYQITQFYQPLARNGHIVLTKEDGLPLSGEDEITVGIKQVQLEQDTAKSQELEDGVSLLDFSRAGQPLIEIISLPHIHSPEAASAYMRKVQGILYAVDAVTTGMELGGLRADINVSVRRLGDTTVGGSYGDVHGLGQRTEIKNLSSFKAVEEAVRAERNRQIQILENGGAILGETRGWSVNKPGETRLLRGKEGEIDYRYMPDPDVPPLYIGNDLISYLREQLPAVPEQLLSLMVERYGLTRVDARSLILLDEGERVDYFQSVVQACTSEMIQQRHYGKMAGNWVLHELGSLITSDTAPWTPSKVPFTSMARIILLSEEGRITGPSAKRVLRIVFEGDEKDADAIIEHEGLWFQPLSAEEYVTLAVKVIEGHPEVVHDIQQKGKHGKLQFLVGQMMRIGERNRMEASKAETALRAEIFPPDETEGSVKI